MAEALEISSSSSDSDAETECLVDCVNQICYGQEKLLQAITDCREDEVVKSSSRGPAVIALLGCLQSNIDKQECKEFGEKMMKAVAQCVSGSSGKKKNCPV